MTSIHSNDHKAKITQHQSTEPSNMLAKSSDLNPEILEEIGMLMC